MLFFGDGRMKGRSLILDILFIAAAQISTYYLVRYVIRRLDPDYNQKVELEKKTSAIYKRLEERSRAAEQAKREANGLDPRKPMPSLSSFGSLNTYEQTVLTEVVAPEEIPVDFSSIGGLEDIIEDLRDSVIFPLTSGHLLGQRSSLIAAPKGVLLYGPPGCGKTLLAKALAKESGACFINLHISTMTEKWYGDSNKIVNAVFSLARKLQPSIIFIDEIDAVLRSRSSNDHEATAMVKAEFMTHWDGLLSHSADAEAQQILVLGATNRIDDIDEAILRRLPKKFKVPLPSREQRKRILELILADSKLSPNFNMDKLVEETAGMSGSDLKEACRDAAMIPVREIIKSMRGGEKVGELRGIENSDFWKGPGNIRKNELSDLREALEDWNEKFKSEMNNKTEIVDEETLG